MLRGIFNRLFQRVKISADVFRVPARHCTAQLHHVSQRINSDLILGVNRVRL